MCRNRGSYPGPAHNGGRGEVFEPFEGAAASCGAKPHAPDSDDDAGRHHEHGGPGDEIQQRCPPCTLPEEEQVMKNVAGNGQNAPLAVGLLNDLVALFRNVVFGAGRIVHRNAMQRNISCQSGNSRVLVGTLQIGVVGHAGRVLGSELPHPFQRLLPAHAGKDFTGVRIDRGPVADADPGHPVHGPAVIHGQPHAIRPAIRHAARLRRRFSRRYGCRRKIDGLQPQQALPGRDLRVAVIHKDHA